MSNLPPAQAVVIGGGVVGASCAYYLVKQGRSVTLIDRGTFGSKCSHGNCGYVSPSHILPLTSPGAITKSLKALVMPNGPFKIRPRFDPSLWSWLLKFAANCTQEKMIEIGHARQTILNSSRGLYSELMSGVLKDCEWTEDGLLFVFKTPGEFEHYAATDQLLKSEYGLAARPIDSDELIRMEPALKPGLAGAWHYAIDAHLRPDRLMSAWNKTLRDLGVTILEKTEFLDFEPAATLDRTCAVETSAGRIPTENVVVATGAWTPQLKTQLGTPIPIQPGKGYSITMDRPAICPRYPMIFEEDRVAITPWPSGYRIGSTMEFTGYDASINRKRLSLLKNGATRYLHEPMGKPIVEEWAGFRPMSADELPIIGPSLRFGNVYIAAGHGMLGLSMGAATGKLVSEMICGQLPHIDPTPYSPRRFLKSTAKTTTP
jgi:D-amino-acid dehydrogenase